MKTFLLFVALIALVTADAGFPDLVVVKDALGVIDGGTLECPLDGTTECCWSITVTNSEDDIRDPVLGIALTDTWPSELTRTSITETLVDPGLDDPNNPYSPSTCGPVTGNGDFTCDIPDMAALRTINFEVCYIAIPEQVVDLQTDNLVSVTTESSDSDENNNFNVGRQVFVVPGVNIRVEKSTLNNPVAVGDAPQFEITITNDGPGLAEDVTGVDVLAPGCNFGPQDIAAGESVTYICDGEVVDETTEDYDNVITVDTPTEEEDKDDNTDEAPVDVIPLVRVTKVAVPDAITVSKRKRDGNGDGDGGNDGGDDGNDDGGNDGPGNGDGDDDCPEPTEAPETEAPEDDCPDEEDGDDGNDDGGDDGNDDGNGDGDSGNGDGDSGHKRSGNGDGDSGNGDGDDDDNDDGNDDDGNDDGDDDDNCGTEPPTEPPAIPVDWIVTIEVLGGEEACINGFTDTFTLPDGTQVDIDPTVIGGPITSACTGLPACIAGNSAASCTVTTVLDWQVGTYNNFIEFDLRDEEGNTATGDNSGDDDLVVS